MKARTLRPTGAAKWFSDKLTLTADGAAPGWFSLPADAAASEPPEARGLGRDEVRLLVAASTGTMHTTFHRLAAFLNAGDVVVVNTSATLAAALEGRRADGRAVTAHVASVQDDGSWVVEIRPPVGATGPVTDASSGELLKLPEGVVLRLVRPYAATATTTRLWVGRPEQLADPVHDYLNRVGRPIAYGYVPERWPLWAYQTVFARHPGSAEMPSAARPFSPEVVVDLVTAGVTIAPITLHTGVSSFEPGEPPMAEPYVVTADTARIVNSTRASGHRVVAVGTTVARALETVADESGMVTAGSGWTELVLGPDRPARVVDGLITGWHEPGASHLLLLEAVAGADLVRTAYRAAVAEGYRWHEFGDSCLLLPA